MKKLIEQLEEIQSFFSQSELKSEKISSATIGWHLDHSLRVINSIVLALEQSNPDLFKPSFNFWRILFLGLAFLPRGRGRAPKKVKPDQEITLVDLNRRLNYAYDNLEKLGSLNSNAYFPHPVFGDLALKQAEKFIRIHTEHHLKIIRDILKG